MESLKNRWKEYDVKRNKYLTKFNENLKNIYGQNKAKHKVKQIIAQWMNGKMEGAVIGFYGPPGTGKTSMAKSISNCLIDDDGSTRPFTFIALGGVSKASTLMGHGYTYVGSKWGKIAGALMDAKCMNPIIFIDELDKLSETPNGKEIVGNLMHILDPEQNNIFMDDYFGVNLDISKALIILSYNKPEVLDTTMRNRITEVSFDAFDIDEKKIIGKEFLLPKITKSIGYTSNDIIFSDESISNIVEHYIYEPGVRRLKDKLYEINREINVRVIEKKISLPFTVSKEFVDEILESKNKIVFTQIPTTPQIGWVNGLYATSMGIGGITVIQISDIISNEAFSLEMTGKLGDVMKESNSCAKTITWKILPDSIKKNLRLEWKKDPWGIHVHFPSAGTPKDGPSGGCAITTAIVSFLCKVPVRNYIAMTGEIDIYGNVRPIGGLQAKVEGAIRAGVKLILYPEKNDKDWNEIKHKYKDSGVMVEHINHISESLQICLLNNDNLQFNLDAEKHKVKDSIKQYLVEMDKMYLK